MLVSDELIRGQRITKFPGAARGGEGLMIARCAKRGRTGRGGLILGTSTPRTLPAERVFNERPMQVVSVHFTFRVAAEL